MARKTIHPPVDSEGFDIVCTIGRVEFGKGDKHPHIAAFELIAEQDMEGTYRFPMANGQTCAVTVDYEGDISGPANSAE